MTARHCFQFLSLMTALAIGNSAGAGLITYSSAGSLLNSGAADPWGLGSGLTPFEFALTLDTSAVDNQSSIVFAEFKDFSVTIDINGSPAGFVASTAQSILFYDIPSSTDQITTQFDVEYNGVTQTIRSIFALPDSTFSFSSALESPPTFAPASTTQQVQAAFGNYSTIIPKNAVISVTSTPTATPEPSSLVLLGMGGVAVMFRRRKRRTLIN